MNSRPHDERFKADIPVVVAHPDDEIMAAAFMAEQVDTEKRVALVWTTRGDGGTNTVGPEQAIALGYVRESDAMHAAWSIGVQNVWDLGGPDMSRQGPLESLETCSHGRSLDRLVRVVRSTRPDVILTCFRNDGDRSVRHGGGPDRLLLACLVAREPEKNMNRL